MQRWSAWDCNFYPRSPCGERPFCPTPAGHRFRISIHALLAESDKCRYTAPATMSDFYPRSPCGERRTQSQIDARVIPISIHALLAESDGIPSGGTGGVDAFLSTLSLRRATYGAGASRDPARDFYPRSPCGERRLRLHAGFQASTISIHALLAESDQSGHLRRNSRNRFLSTLSLRRATCALSYSSR